MAIQTNRGCEHKIGGIEDRELDDHPSSHKFGLCAVGNNQGPQQTNRAASPLVFENFGAVRVLN